MTQANNNSILYPLDVGHLQRKNRKMRRTLRENETLTPVKVAVLGGSTTAEMVKFIDLFLLQQGFNPEFYQSEFNQFFEEAVFENSDLAQFSPQFIYVHTSSMNITKWPDAFASEEEVSLLVEQTYQHFEQVWQSLAAKFEGATIIQNNFEAPFSRPLGNFDATAYSGKSVFVSRLNDKFAQYARNNRAMMVHDIHYQAAWFGLERWYDRRQWHAYKYAMSTDAFPLLGRSVAAQINAVLGRSKKCLVCDLDNTLWGGVVGDDGVDGLKLGHETPQAAAFSEMQQYVHSLKQRGVLLAISSKNDIHNAKLGLAHPDSQLAVSDFTQICANWQCKDTHLKSIAADINIGLDSLVFIDDNPAERQLVSEQLPSVSVPNIGHDISQYISVLDKAGYFEITSLNKEDATRGQMYLQNNQRAQQQAQFSDYRQFLYSLEMKADIGPFEGVYLSRIAQLTNKTNQFNLTTQRYTEQEISALSESDQHVTLYGRLSDCYGDNGLVSVIVGRIVGKALHVELWLMSCRVIKREFELAMFTALKTFAVKADCEEIIGTYIPTTKNALVAEHYPSLGFDFVQQHDNGHTIWKLALTNSPQHQEIPITINYAVEV
ncbi:HAD-IIIC family phosphatase [Vibrio sp. Of7-15]|uniref:HAD-IIIC family phosphatase n=1 Tax=Vibrio sp. Of7-15 TaxID=2724879 RepID=UPI001EF247CC|nr:HAD-IIIC family phosphatase [Vibrio sp. Of7-15]MCG7499640.1 HAD-IIIC family phosphatase [Vibrio sp. Of7-15]